MRLSWFLQYRLNYAEICGISCVGLRMMGAQVIVAFRKSAVAKPGDDTFATETDADPVCLSFNIF